MIKKQFFGALLLFISLHSFAQLNKGKIMINGRGNFYAVQSEGDEYNTSTTSHNTYKKANANLHLNIGRFVTDYFAIGLSAGYGRNTDHSTYLLANGAETNIKNTNQNMAIGVFGRYNFMIRDSKFGVFFQLDNSYQFGKDGYEYSILDNNLPSTGEVDISKGHGFRVGVTPGILYFISNKVSIEAFLGDVSYESFVLKGRPQQSSSTKGSGFNANFSTSSFYLGFTFYLGGKKEEAKSSQ